jgi:hypothetical protein
MSDSLSLGSGCHRFLQEGPSAPALSSMAFSLAFSLSSPFEKARQRALEANTEAAQRFAAQQIEANGIHSLRGVARALTARGICGGRVVRGRGGQHSTARLGRELVVVATSRFAIHIVGLLNGRTTSLTLRPRSGPITLGIARDLRNEHGGLGVPCPAGEPPGGHFCVGKGVVDCRRYRLAMPT